MEHQPSEQKEKTALVQSVVPVSVAEEIKAAATSEGRTVSGIIAQTLKARFAKRSRKTAKHAA